MDRVYGPELWNNACKHLERKKKTITAEIRNKCKLLEEMLISWEKETLAQLDQKSSEIETKMKELLEINDGTSKWEQSIQEQLKVLNGKN